MQIEYLLTCDYAVQDALGRTAAIGIFDSMQLATPLHPNQPYLLNPFFLAGKLRGTISEGTKHTLQLQLALPKGEPITLPMQMELTFGTFARSPEIVSEFVIRLVNGIPIPSPKDGDYHINVLLDGNMVGARTLHVICPPRPTSRGSNGTPVH